MRKSKITALIKVKSELAAKYMARAEQTKSTPRRKTYLNKALGYRRQTATLQTMLAQA